MSLVGERVSETLIDDLPNLKIEIENDLDHKMETEDEASSIGKALSESSETEEGEVVDDDEDRLDLTGKKASSALAALTTVPTGRSILKYDTKEYIDIQQQATVKNRNGAFVTGVNVFSPEEQAKLDKRAQRFGIEASEAKVLTEKLLKKLYKSMCVKPTDKNIRTEALHMRGTQSMTTEDVFNYFKDYGPASLEWITDNSCNVVWLDDISAARALLGLSLHISGQPAPPSPERRPSLSDSDVDMETQTQVNKLGPKEPSAADDTECLSEESDAVPLSELRTELPPGRWRRGAPHPLSTCILLRFATTKDRSAPRPGFTKFGSHQFGGYIGLISESRKRRLQNALPDPLLFEDVGDEIIPKPSADKTDTANPWGTLAKTWSQFDRVRKPRPPSPIIERLLPLPTRKTPPPSPPDFMTQRVKLVAHRRGRHRRVSDPGENSSGEEEWRKRSKMPRMRMHADDEEEKRDRRMKRVHRNRSLSVSPPRHKDLRRKLVAHREHSDAESTEEPEPVVVEPDEEDDEVPDLRVAVPAERSSSPEDSKAGVRQSLFQTGNVKSVLRGARGHSDVDEDEDGNDEDKESEDSAKAKSSVRRHRSRSKERRKHHRKHHKESSYHKSRRRDDDSDSEENTGKIKSTIRRKSPEPREKVRSESREKRTSRERRKRGDDDHRKLESSRKSDSRRHEKPRSKKDLRSKISHRHKSYDEDNEFRSKSPLQIEIDNDEYYKAGESD